jgi:hypothetical protein
MGNPFAKTGCGACAQRRRLLMEQAAAAARAAGRGDLKEAIRQSSAVFVSTVSGAAAMAGIIPKELPTSISTAAGDVQPESEKSNAR